MSNVNKRQIRTMLDNSARVAKRYRSITNIYLTNPVHGRLFFHNNIHGMAMVQVVDTLAKMTGNVTKDELELLHTAAAWHDCFHTGHPDSWKDENGKDNIDRTIEQYNDYTVKNNKVWTPAVVRLIQGTRFPYDYELPRNTGPNAIAIGMSEREVFLLGLLRDADAVWGMLHEYSAQSVVGLWLERTHAGEEEKNPDPEEVVRRRMSFLKSVKPFTAAGKNFFRAFLDETLEDTERLYMEMTRQNQLAELVGDLTLDELAQYRAGKTINQIHAARAAKAAPKQGEELVDLVPTLDAELPISGMPVISANEILEAHGLN
jgi:hypothetical protein